MLTALFSLSLAFADKTLLDCAKPRAEDEKVICLDATTAFCEASARRGFMLYAELLGKQIADMSVTVVQPDAVYLIGFKIPGDTFGLDYAQNVYVTRDGGACALSRIEGAGK